jgi:hypothetical protein
MISKSVSKKVNPSDELVISHRPRKESFSPEWAMQTMMVGGMKYNPLYLNGAGDGNRTHVISLGS